MSLDLTPLLVRPDLLGEMLCQMTFKQEVDDLFEPRLREGGWFTFDLRHGFEEAGKDSSFHGAMKELADHWIEDEARDSDELREMNAWFDEGRFKVHSNGTITVAWFEDIPSFLAFDLLGLHRSDMFLSGLVGLDLHPKPSRRWLPVMPRLDDLYRPRLAFLPIDFPEDAEGLREMVHSENFGLYNLAFWLQQEIAPGLKDQTMVELINELAMKATYLGLRPQENYTSMLAMVERLAPLMIFDSANPAHPDIAMKQKARPVLEDAIGFARSDA